VAIQWKMLKRISNAKVRHLLILVIIYINPSLGDAQHKSLMAEDTTIESHNKKYREAVAKAMQTRDRVARAEHMLSSSRECHSVDQQKISNLEKAQKAEATALSNLSKVAAASTSLLHSGSGKVAMLLPPVNRQ
jgi:hypothetical protein